MPDVKLWMDESIHAVRPDLTLLKITVESVVAWEMSCLVPTPGSADEFYQLSMDEIDITVVGSIYGNSGASVIMEVAAYDYPDRMNNIKKRITAIATAVKVHLKLEETQYVSITFIPVPVGCWARV